MARKQSPFGPNAHGAWQVDVQSVDVIDGSTVVALVADDKVVELHPINSSAG